MSSILEALTLSNNANTILMGDFDLRWIRESLFVNGLDELRVFDCVCETIVRPIRISLCSRKFEEKSMRNGDMRENQVETEYKTLQENLACLE